ncbi:MAG: LysM peptidoglycan-binding domain-containing protein [Lachnospiraceae bacterium]|nr:LysM peptidoglycan-binding domain-containing protein [Lachnospiraceae bacterium]
MGNENLLPKNIRQIGEIQGRQKICLEDYVVTYIRKIENRGDENFLGIFLGERKNTENADYVFVRGLMEVSEAKEQKGGRAAADVNGQKSRMTAAAEKNAGGQMAVSAGESAKIRSRKGVETNREAMVQISGKNTDEKTDDEGTARFGGKNADAENFAAQGGQNEASDKDITKEKISLWEAFQRRYGTQEETEEAGQAKWRQITDKADSSKKHTKEISREAAAEAKNTKRFSRMTETENPKQSVEEDKGLNAQKEAYVEPQDIWEQLKKECEERFSGCEILGCCVIGAYPAGRAEELSSHIPEAGQMLYHLQDQEERLYWRDGDRFEGVNGYFVFYEQNRQMQAYLAETFGGGSTEKEKVSDDAIRSFREKVKSKAQERSRSFLKLASSFFVVGVLIIGVVMVNRVADLRQVQSVVETVGGTSVTEEAATSRMEEGVTSQREESITDPSGSGGEDSGGADLENAGTETDDANANVAVVSSAGSDSSDASSDNGSDASNSILTGSDAFWADDESSDGDVPTVSESASVSESAAADSGSASSSGNAVNSVSVSASDAAASDVETSSNREAAADTSSEAASGSSSEDTSADATVPSDSAEGADVSATLDAATVTAAGTAAEAASETTAAETTVETTADSDPDSVSGSEDGDDAAEASARQVQAAYVIREGDTLAEICARYYGSLDYLEALCEANEIEDANLILPGQKIVLP